MAQYENEHKEHSFMSLAFVGGFLIGIMGLIILATAPWAKLVGGSGNALPGAMHGLAAMLLLFVSTMGLYLAWRLFTCRIKAFADLQLISVVIATLSFLTIIFGNWIYIFYRAKSPDSVRSWLMANAPDIHKIFFEFKEFTALFTLPLAVAAAYILWRYGRQVIQNNMLRIAVSLLLAFVFSYILIAFGLGAAVTKIRAI